MEQATECMVFVIGLTALSYWFHINFNNKDKLR